MPLPQDPDRRLNNAERAVAHELAHAVRDGECLLSHRQQPSNTYPRVRFRVQGRIRTLPVHRLVMLVKAGPLPEGAETRHLCGRHWCINPEHLAYDTRSENARDALEHGRKPQVKMTIAQVRDIRKRYVPGVNHANRGTAVELAREYGLSTVQVRNIGTGRHWQRVEG